MIRKFYSFINLNTLTRFIIFIFYSTTAEAQVDTQDSLALVDLYRSTNGQAWVFNNNWLTTSPVSTWTGITLDAFGTRVTQIDLSDNSLSGIIPSSIGNLTALEVLNFAHNSITGSIPSSIGNLTNLNILKIPDNLLSGGIPTSIGNLNGVKYLLLNGNNLSGSIPASIGSIQSLVDLEMHHNLLNDSIPSSIGNLPNLAYLNLYNNQLSYSIPPSIGNLVNASQINLSFNQISGTIPSTIENLRNVSTFNLSHNQLSGSIPSTISNCNFGQLDFSYNTLSGTIPPILGDPQNLIYLDLSHNQFGGAIPANLGTYYLMEQIFLSNNLLNGSIPSSLGMLGGLYYLDLSSNQLTDSVPVELGNLHNLRIFSVANNMLKGIIPIGIASSTRGQINNVDIHLENNEFTFDCVEPWANIYTYTVGSLTYSPQANIPLHFQNDTLSVAAGGTIALNTYKWYKDNNLQTTLTGDSLYMLVSPGSYSATVTNSVANQLTLYSNVFNFNALPLTLSEFKVGYNDNKPLLAWKTINESNVSYFSIERSTDGTYFTQVGKVNAVINNTLSSSYSFIDSTASNENHSIIYYRLQIVDKDRKFVYSTIITAHLSMLYNDIKVNPNPVSGTAIIQYHFDATAKGRHSIALLDNSGKLIHLYSVNINGILYLNMSNKSSGLYYVALRNDLSVLKIAKVIVN